MRPLSLTFLGTCSGGGPIYTRNCTSTALNFARKSWLIDCAEATQHQMLRVKVPKPWTIDRIFITHMHVDHVFGIVPLMSTVMSPFTHKGPPDAIRLQIYGPAGLRSFLRHNLKTTSLFLGGKYQTHELLASGDPRTSCDGADLHENEAPGEDIFVSADGTWPAFASTKEAKISAGPLQHRIPSLGYVFEEPTHPVISPEWIEYLDSLPPEQLPEGMTSGRQFVSRFLARTGDLLLLADGTPLPLPTAQRRGRKVVVLGDTSDASGIAELAQNADVLVHEATSAPVSLSPGRVGKEENEVAETARSRGHSTPRMAGEFARKVGARRLVLNHFSSMYPGSFLGRAPWPPSPDSVMEQIRMQAATAFGSPNVVTADDGLELDVPFHPSAFVGDSGQSTSERSTEILGDALLADLGR
ncbi:hypothetical protein AURDEDRAFT_103870 [Auricularia subglabra TFB-10046 SS5]|nr:hypothetical protein AURDEDRAFT_103870 [Auricularia subglabra TFB-10046 SS5]